MNSGASIRNDSASKGSPAAMEYAVAIQLGLSSTGICIYKEVQFTRLTITGRTPHAAFAPSCDAQGRCYWRRSHSGQRPWAQSACGGPAATTAVIAGAGVERSHRLDLPRRRRNDETETGKRQSELGKPCRHSRSKPDRLSFLSPQKLVLPALASRLYSDLRAFHPRFDEERRLRNAVLGLDAKSDDAGRIFVAEHTGRQKERALCRRPGFWTELEADLAAHSTDAAAIRRSAGS